MEIPLLDQKEVDVPTKSLTRKINVSCNKIFNPSKTKVKLENEDNDIKQATTDETKALLENIIKEATNEI